MHSYSFVRNRAMQAWQEQCFSCSGYETHSLSFSARSDCKEHFPVPRNQGFYHRLFSLLLLYIFGTSLTAVLKILKNLWTSCRSFLLRNRHIHPDGCRAIPLSVFWNCHILVVPYKYQSNSFTRSFFISSSISLYRLKALLPPCVPTVRKQGSGLSLFIDIADKRTSCQMAACHFINRSFDFVVSTGLRLLRCGQLQPTWISFYGIIVLLFGYERQQFSSYSL